MNTRAANLAVNMQHLEAVLAEVEKLPDAELRERVRLIVRTLLDFHAEGLARIVEILQNEGERGRSLLETLAESELVGSLLLLHDLHPTESADASFGRIGLPIVPSDSALRVRQ